MEEIRFRKIVYLPCIMLILFCCHAEKKYSRNFEIDGHWYAVYGEVGSSYGEAIYVNGKACFYSDDFGLVYRSYQVEHDTVIKIYNGAWLQEERRIRNADSFKMIQVSMIEGQPPENMTVRYYKITNSDIDRTKLLARDTSEQYRYIDGYRIRREEWMERNGVMSQK